MLVEARHWGRTRGGLREYVIGHEQHTRPAGSNEGTAARYSLDDELHSTPADPARPRHKHFFLHYNSPTQHRDARYCQIFDMRGQHGRTLHPHIQGVGPTKRDRENVIRYTQKDKLYIASPNLEQFSSESSSRAWAIEMNSAETVREGMHGCTNVG